MVLFTIKTFKKIPYLTLHSRQKSCKIPELLRVYCYKLGLLFIWEPMRLYVRVPEIEQVEESVTKLKLFKLVASCLLDSFIGIFLSKKLLLSLGRTDNLSRCSMILMTVIFSSCVCFFLVTFYHRANKNLKAFIFPLTLIFSIGLGEMLNLFNFKLLDRKDAFRLVRHSETERLVDVISRSPAQYIGIDSLLWFYRNLNGSTLISLGNSLTEVAFAPRLTGYFSFVI